MRRAVRYACTHLKPGFEVGTHFPRRYLTVNFQTLRSVPRTPRINVGSEDLRVIFLILLPSATWNNIEFEGRGLDLVHPFKVKYWLGLPVRMAQLT